MRPSGHVTGGYFTNANEASGHVTFILNVIIQYNDDGDPLLVNNSSCIVSEGFDKALLGGFTCQLDAMSPKPKEVRMSQTWKERSLLLCNQSKDDLVTWSWFSQISDCIHHNCCILADNFQEEHCQYTRQKQKNRFIMSHVVQRCSSTMEPLQWHVEAVKLCCYLWLLLGMPANIINLKSVSTVLAGAWRNVPYWNCSDQMDWKSLVSESWSAVQLSAYLCVGIWQSASCQSCLLRKKM